MEQLDNGRLAIDSAFESEVIGRAVARGADDGTTQYYFRHPGYEYPARNERQFFDREMRTGRLVLSGRMAELAETGINAIISTETPFNGVTPDMAQRFRTVIDRSRAARLLSEVPPLDETAQPKETEAEISVVAA